MKSQKKAGGKPHNRKSKPHNNALLHTDTIVEEKKEASLPVKEIKKPSRHMKSVSAEKTDVFEIIADLEKQLDAAFSLKDAQENKIHDLKENLERAQDQARALESELDRTRAKLIAQEKLKLELESFENEQFKVLGEKSSLKEELKASSAVIKDLEDKIAALAKGGESWNTRIGQMEHEIKDANTMIQNLRRQIAVLEDAKGVLSDKMEAMESDLASAVTERDRYKKEAGEARESLDEIRMTLVDTRARARGHYYKKKTK